MQDISTADDALAMDAASPLDTPAGAGPVVIQVSGVSKSFRIPAHDLDASPRSLRRNDYRELHAVRDISFDVHKGEFFGIVGRNGSGKSTLLKILASIYRQDAGRVRVAGRIAPFIELGVGFNPELTARENSEVSGVIMGLSRREARHRLDAVLDFAELRDYVELKVKNYSSGMMVRLAFAIMIQADADIMLIDEVLAVGDASFSRKCMDVFYARREAGKTIVLVTHDMGTVQSMCHRAMVIQDGALMQIGDPKESALAYYRLNFPEPSEAVLADAASGSTEPAAMAGGPRSDAASDGRVITAGLVTAGGRPAAELQQGTPIRLEVVIEAARDLLDPVFSIQIRNQDDVVISGIRRTLRERVLAGQHVRLAGDIQNLLVPGQYRLECSIREDQMAPELGQKAMPLVEFSVHGSMSRHGVASLDANVEVTPSR